MHDVQASSKRCNKRCSPSLFVQATVAAERATYAACGGWRLLIGVDTFSGLSAYNNMTSGVHGSGLTDATRIDYFLPIHFFVNNAAVPCNASDHFTTQKTRRSHYRRAILTLLRTISSNGSEISIEFNMTSPIERIPAELANDISFYVRTS